MIGNQLKIAEARHRVAGRFGQRGDTASSITARAWRTSVFPPRAGLPPIAASTVSR
jgi:hypothetical protein